MQEPSQQATPRFFNDESEPHTDRFTYGSRKLRALQMTPPSELLIDLEVASWAFEMDFIKYDPDERVLSESVARQTLDAWRTDYDAFISAPPQVPVPAPPGGGLAVAVHRGP